MSVAWLLAPASAALSGERDIAWVLVAGGTAIFVLVMVLAAFAVRGTDPAGRSRPIRTRRWVVGGGIVFPVAVLTALLVYVSTRDAAGEASRTGDVGISVTAHLWWWEVSYHAGDGAVVRSANEIRVPVGRRVRIALTSNDVIHSFWIPALSGKVDMLPGRITHVAFDAKRAGTYRGQCAEYCGDMHAKMALHVIALPPSDYDAWLREQAQPARAPEGEAARRGREVFLAGGCGACHAVRGLVPDAAEPQTTRGPDLTHVASRDWLGAGTLRNGPGVPLTWAMAVQDVKPGARMPSAVHLPAPDAQALGAFLDGLR